MAAMDKTSKAAQIPVTLTKRSPMLSTMASSQHMRHISANRAQICQGLTVGVILPNYFGTIPRKLAVTRPIARRSSTAKLGSRLRELDHGLVFATIRPEGENDSSPSVDCS